MRIIFKNSTLVVLLAILLLFVRKVWADNTINLTKEECDYASGWGISCHSQWDWNLEKKYHLDYSKKNQNLFDVIKAVSAHNKSDYDDRINRINEHNKIEINLIAITGGQYIAVSDWVLKEGRPIKISCPDGYKLDYEFKNRNPRCLWPETINGKDYCFAEESKITDAELKCVKE